MTMNKCVGCENMIHISAPNCPKCGSKQISSDITNNDQIKKQYEWSFWSPMMSVDFAGRGMVEMGIIMTLVNFMPPMWILSSLILKKKMIRDFGTIEFRWSGQAIAVFVLQITVWLVVIGLGKH